MITAEKCPYPKNEMIGFDVPSKQHFFLASGGKNNERSDPSKGNICRQQNQKRLNHPHLAIKVTASHVEDHMK